MACRHAHVMGDARRLRSKAVQLEPHRNDGVVVRPDGAGLIVVRIECAVVGGQGANAPSGPHVRRHQALDHPLCALGRHDAGPQAMTGVGCNAQHLLLVAVERIGIEPKFLIPESLVEPRVQGRRFGPQFRRAFAACRAHQIPRPCASRR